MLTSGRRRTLKAAADYSSQALYSCIKDDSTGGQGVVCTAKTDKVIGVSESQPGSGGELLVFIPNWGDEVTVVASAAIALGALVTATTGGKVVTDDAATGNFILGPVIHKAATADADLCTIRWMPHEGT